MVLIQFLVERGLPQLLRIKAEEESAEDLPVVLSQEHLDREEAEQIPLLDRLAQAVKAMQVGLVRAPETVALEVAARVA